MKQKTNKKSRVQCPLDNPNIDIIPENNHLVGICLCEFCKCGKHICPKNRHLAPKYLSDSFSTSYSRHFKQAQFDVPYKVHPIPYKPNSQKMDFTTTNSINFKGHSVNLVEKKVTGSYSSPKKTLFSTTAYKYNYPDWGHQKINYEKGWHAPVRSVDIPFRGDTAYSREFLKIDLKKVHNFNPKKFDACQSHISISPSDSFNPRTTYNEKMKDFSRSRLNTHVEIPIPKAVSTPATSNHYITSTDRFFKPSTSSYLDPRKVRIALLSRGSIS